MNRRQFLGSLAAATAARAAQRRPNFVFILADDYGWTDTSFNGSRFYETPNLDRLARQGMVFTDAYSASPVCSPTRSAIMTGKWPARLHITSHLQGASNRLHFTRVLQPNARLALPLEETTIAETLQKAGYRTACIGKWHLGAKGFLPSDQGFDVALAGDEAGSTSSFFYPKWKTKVNLEGADGDYLTDRLTTLAVDFLRENRDRPFFLYLPHFAVHTPIEGKPDKVKKYEAKADPKNPQNYAEYAAMVESLDESVGRVLDALDELKLADNTLVIFTADNGGVVSREWKKRPITSNLPLRSGKGHLYEGGIRVPTIARLPGVTKPGSRCGVPVLSVDYAPTLAEMAGTPMKGVDGRSLRKLLGGAQKLDRQDIFWHYPHYSPQLGRPSAAIRRGNYKLIYFFEDSRAELYNLAADIGETRDLAGLEPNRAAAMRARLLEWLRETGAQIPQPNPGYDPKRELEPGKPSGPVTAK
jgi:arylsulfatase A-like enzyme